MNFRDNVLPGTVVDHDGPLSLSKADPTSSSPEGRIKVQIPHLFGQVPTPSLPWAFPWDGSMAGGAIGSGSLKVPPIGQKVWVSIENMKLMEPIFYMSSVRLGVNKGPWPKFLATIFPQLIGSTLVYPDMDLTVTPNGMAYGIGYGPTGKEAFIYHPGPPPTTVHINSAGKIRVTAGGQNLYTIITSLLTADAGHTHVTAVGLSGPPSTASQITTALTQLQMIFAV